MSNLIYRSSQKGIAHIFLLILLVAGIGLGVYLIQQRTNILPFAKEAPCPVSGPCPTPPPPPPSPSPSSSPSPVPRALVTDFNGDGKSDLAVFRTSENKWFVKGLPFVSWGRADQGDIPVPADYDGDGRADYAVYHRSNQPNQSFFYIRYATGQEQNVMMGGWDESNFIPAPADYDGDGKVDPVVWDPATGAWSGPGIAPTKWGRGDQGDIPAPGDYNGDGKADFAVYHPPSHPSQSWFYIKYANGQEGKISIQWAGLRSTPAVGDYNGDGKTDAAVWDPENGVWYLQEGVVTGPQWGKDGDLPVPGDYNGDGKYDFAVWRPSDGTWYVKDVANTSWGRADQGDIPLPKSPTK